MEARPADERVRLAASACRRVLRAERPACCAQAAAEARHIPKRARRDKNTEAVFDEKARR